MAEVKDKLVTVESLDAVHDSLLKKISLSTLGVTATPDEINKLDGVTATTTELNYVAGVTSGVQSQINSLNANVSSKANTSYVDSRVNSKANTPIPSTGTLIASEWSSNLQTISVNGVTASTSNIVIVSPDPGSYTAYTQSGVRCTSQAAGKLTFTCDSVPSADLVVNVVILS